MIIVSPSESELSPVLPITINAFLQKATSLRKDAKTAKFFLRIKRQYAALFEIFA